MIGTESNARGRVAIETSLVHNIFVLVTLSWNIFMHGKLMVGF
jgi:hypothetical protein